MDYPSGYGIVFKKYLSDPSISIQAKGMYALLASYTGSSEVCWPSQTRLATDLGVSKRSIVGWLAELEKVGLIQVERREGEVNRYKLVIPTPVQPVALPSEAGCTRPVQPVAPIRLTVKRNKKNCASDADRKRVIGTYLRLFEEKSGSKTTADPATIGSMGYLIQHRGVDQVLMVLERYFHNGFFFNKQGYSFRNMYSHYDEILSSIPQKQEDKEEDYRCPSCGKKPTGHRSGAPFCFKCSMNCVEVMV